MVCDHCKKETRYTPTWGGSTIHGWFSVKRVNGSTTLNGLSKKKDWDFCSVECLRAFDYDPSQPQYEAYKPLMIDWDKFKDLK